MNIEQNVCSYLVLYSSESTVSYRLRCLLGTTVVGCIMRIMYLYLAQYPAARVAIKWINRTVQLFAQHTERNPNPSFPNFIASWTTRFCAFNK